MINTKTFRLFISSTFNDFRREREVLQTKVFPTIKEYCSQKGYTFQPIDLRWGVTEEAQLDQKTLELCLDEVRSCKSYPYPNFLVMLGDRYGWVPLPYAIEKNEFELLQKKIEDHDEILTIKYKQYKVYNDLNDTHKFHYEKKKSRNTSKLELLQQWYILDENQIPISYTIKERDSKSDYKIYENWEAEENILCEVLQTVVKDSILGENQKRKYFMSATEAEIKEGITSYINHTEHQIKLLKINKTLEKIDPEYIFGFLRCIDKSTKIGDMFMMDDCNEAQNLKNRVKKTILNENILEVKTQQIDKENLDDLYLIELQEKIIEFLKERINRQIAEEEDLTSLNIEIEEQKYFAEQKRENFIGQEDVLEKISEYIENTETQALVIHGASGMGKSSIMAKAIEEACEKYKSYYELEYKFEKEIKKVIYRFVGATANSSSSKEVIISLFDELDIDLRYKKDKQKQNIELTRRQGDNQESFEEFSYRVYDQLMNLTDEIVIFIDAVDQIVNDDQFLWLPNNLPVNIKIIISALEDDNYKEESNYFNILKSKTNKSKKVQLFNSPKDLIFKLLKKEKRTIQQHQLEYFLKQYQDVKSPLYVTVAAEEMKYWKSYDGVPGNIIEENGKKQKLADSQKGIITEYISNLHELYHHDERFIQKILGYIYASKDGLSESELLQLLSMDNEFIKAVVPDEHHKNISGELPLVIWTRFYTQFKPFLSQKNQDGEELLYFFHREFEDVIKKIPIQREEHEAIITVTQLFIKKNQDKPFDENRWGRLYMILLEQYGLRYPNKAKQKEFSKFIIQLKNKIWIDNWLKNMIYNGYKYDIYNKIMEAILYVTSTLEITILLYTKEPDYWVKRYITASNNKSNLYHKIGRSKEALSIINKSSLIVSDLYYNKSKDIWAYERVIQLFNRAKFSYGVNRKFRARWHALKATVFCEENSVNNSNNEWKALEASILHEVSVFYYTDAWSDKKVAIDFQKKALGLYKDLFDENSDYWADKYLYSLFHLSRLYRMVDSDEEGINLAKIGYEISKELYLNNPSRWQITHAYQLFNMAESSYKKYKQKNAIKFYEESLLIFEKLYLIYPDQWKEPYADILQKMSYYYLAEERENEFNNSAAKCMDILKQEKRDHIFDKWTEKYISILESFENIYTKKGQIEDAKKFRKKKYLGYLKIMTPSSLRFLYDIVGISLLVWYFFY